MRNERLEIDKIDRAILGHLEKQGRATLAEIGETVGLSAAAVKRRKDRLESIGVVRGYSAVLDHSILGFGLEAFVELLFSGTSSVSAIESMIEEVPEIQEIYTIAGDPDALARIRARDVAELTQIIDRIRHTGLVTGTKTHIVLGSRSRATGYEHASGDAS